MRSYGTAEPVGSVTAQLGEGPRWDAEAWSGDILLGALHTVLTGITLSNGLGWDAGGHLMYYIDSPTQRIDVMDFDAASGAVANRRPFAVVPRADGIPDGLAVADEGGLWVALYGGGQVRRFGADGTVGTGRCALRQRDRVLLRGQPPLRDRTRGPVRARRAVLRPAGPAFRRTARYALSTAPSEADPTFARYRANTPEL